MNVLRHFSQGWWGGPIAEPPLAFAARERWGVTGLPPSCREHPWQQRHAVIRWSHPWSPLRSNNSVKNKSNRCAPFVIAGSFIFWSQLVCEMLQHSIIVFGLFWGTFKETKFLLDPSITPNPSIHLFLLRVAGAFPSCLGAKTGSRSGKGSSEQGHAKRLTTIHTCVCVANFQLAISPKRELNPRPLQLQGDSALLLQRKGNHFLAKHACNRR